MAVGLECRERSLLVDTYEAAVAGDIRRKNGRQPSFDPCLGHYICPDLVPSRGFSGGIENGAITAGIGGRRNGVTGSFCEAAIQWTEMSKRIISVVFHPWPVMSAVTPI